VNGCPRACRPRTPRLQTRKRQNHDSSVAHVLPNVAPLRRRPTPARPVAPARAVRETAPAADPKMAAKIHRRAKKKYRNFAKTVDKQTVDKHDLRAKKKYRNFPKTVDNQTVDKRDARAKKKYRNFPKTVDKQTVDKPRSRGGWLCRLGRVWLPLMAYPACIPNGMREAFADWNSFQTDRALPIEPCLAHVHAERSKGGETGSWAAPASMRPAAAAGKHAPIPSLAARKTRSGEPTATPSASLSEMLRLTTRLPRAARSGACQHEAQYDFFDMQQLLRSTRLQSELCPATSASTSPAAFWNSFFVTLQVFRTSSGIR